MIINIIHEFHDDEHLAKVMDEMRRLGSPRIRIVSVSGNLYALEGCHRLRAAQELGVEVVIIPVDYDATIDLNTLDFDDMGWFDDRGNVPVSDLFERMYPDGQAEDFVNVEITLG